MTDRDRKSIQEAIEALETQIRFNNASPNNSNGDPSLAYYDLRSTPNDLIETRYTEMIEADYDLIYVTAPASPKRAEIHNEILGRHIELLKSIL